MSATVKVRVPGTTANCGPGFDVIGIACNVYNEMTLTLTDNDEISIVVRGEGSTSIPRDEKNIAYRAICEVFRLVGKECTGLAIEMNNAIPLARGLGSSAAAIVAGLVAANTVTGNKLSDEAILNLATTIEGHPDNVAPAIYGGVTVTVMRDEKPLTLRFLPANPLKLVVAVPDFGLSTKTSREVLPQVVSFKDAVFNIGTSSLLVGALCQGRADLLKYALEDRLHQPYRQKLIPGMSEVFSAAVAAGALGAAISGAGPCLIAFTQGNESTIGEAMTSAFSYYGVKSSFLVLNIDSEGAKVL
jgi:homoserine kinase